MQSDAPARAAAPFTEKGFYLGEFRDRTLALALASGDLVDPSGFGSVLAELERNRTGVVVITRDPAVLTRLADTPRVAPEEDRLEGCVWRALRRAHRVGLVVGAEREFPAECRRIALRLRVAKLVWIDRLGGLIQPETGRRSFVDLDELGLMLRSGAHAERAALLGEIEAALREGLSAVNLCAPAGLSDELFTYAGSGTLFTRERYVDVRRLGVDDFAAADDLIARGVAEGYLAPRSAEEIDRVFANAFGAFVEGRHLAGIGALLPLAESNGGEIASLYTLTRFLGEGIGGVLLAALVGCARSRGYSFVFACTTTEPVASFFERNGFRRVPSEKIPEEKWRGYDPLRRARARCLLRDLPPGPAPG